MSLAPASTRRCACLLLVLGVAGCTGWDDPFQREGTWRAEYNNDANLGAMVADPGQLVEGVNDNASPGALSAAAVRRLLTDNVKPLPAVDSTDMPASTAGPAPAPAAATGAAAGATQ